MEFSAERRYKLVFDTGSSPLTFTGTNVIIEGDFIMFEDKFGKTLTYNKSRLISLEEVE